MSGYELPEDVMKLLTDEEGSLDDEQELSKEPEQVQEEVQEPKVPEVQAEEITQPELQQPETPAWMEDISRIESRLEVYHRQIKETLDQYMRGAPQVQRQEDYSIQYEQDPAMLKIQEIERQQQELNRMIAIGNERTSMNNAVAGLASKYPDFYNLIPPQLVESAFQESVRQGVKLPWQAHLEQNYWLRKGPQIAQELEAQREAARKQADEVERRRVIKEQKQKDSLTASSVPSGGNPFQQREMRLDPQHHGYADAIANAKAAMQQQLGG